MKKLKISLFVFCLMLSSVIFSACDKTSVSLSADASVVNPGDHVQLISTVKGKSLDYDDFTYHIVLGDDYANVSESGILTVDSDAVPDSVIKVQSEYKKTKSNVLVITVGRVPATALALTANGTTIEPGASLTLTATPTPSNTTDKNAVYTIVEGTDLASIHTDSAGNVLLQANNTATIGSKIKVKASLGSVESNVIEIEVVPTTGSLNYIGFENTISNDTITLDMTDSASLITLIPELINTNGKDASATFECEVVEGGDYLAVSSNAGKTEFDFTVKGHGTAKIQVRAIGKNANNVNLTVNTIVTPESIDIPAYLKGTSSKNYQTGSYDANRSNFLPFDLVAEYDSKYTGGVCEDYALTFAYQGEKPTGYVEPSYQNGEIKFYTAGTYTISASTNSGAKEEKVVEDLITIEVNSLRNVYTYEEFKNAITNVESVNIVASTEINGAYDLVPKFLADKAWTNDADLMNKAKNAGIDVNMTTTKNSLVINGNGHRINVSSMPLIKDSTYANKNNDMGALIDISMAYLIDAYGANIEPHVDKNNTVINKDLTPDATVYSIDINNVDFMGAMSMNPFGTDAADWEPYQACFTDSGYYAGHYTRGVVIGSDRMFKKLLVNMDSVEVEGFSVGLRISGTKTLNAGEVNEQKSVLKNVAVRDIFKAGMELSANILTIKDSELGLCGQGAIEVTPDSCNRATLDPNTPVNQTITFDNVDMGDGAVCEYNTPYFDVFIKKNELGDSTSIIDVLAGALMQYEQIVKGELDKLSYPNSEATARFVYMSLMNAIMPGFVTGYDESKETYNFDETKGQIGFAALVFAALNYDIVNTSVVDSTEGVFDSTAINATTLGALQTSGGAIAQKYIKISLGDNGFAILLNRTYVEPAPQG